MDIIEGTVTEDTTKPIRTVADLAEPFTNCNNIAQHKQFLKTNTFEITSSWSHVLGFNYSSTTGAAVEAGPVFAKVSGSLNFTSGYTSEEAWSRSTTKRREATEITDVYVEARTQTTVRAVFYQRVLKAPYDIIYAIEGKEYKVHGEWVGTAEDSEIIWGTSIRINPATHPKCTGSTAAASANDEVNPATPTETTTAPVGDNRIFLPLIANAVAAIDELNGTVTKEATLELVSAEANGTPTTEAMTDVASAELNATSTTETMVGGTESNRIYLPLIANANL